jgi:hypothetical protein
MTSWKKRFSAMVADPDPRSYTYDDAADILRRLGFHPASRKRGGSHRLWRLERRATDTSKESIYVQLVDAGHGTLKPVYVRKMIETLRAAGLLQVEE